MSDRRAIGKSEKYKRPRTACVEHNQKGRYERVWWNGKLAAGHVRVYEMAHGPIPDDWEVDHLCGNCRCIRLDHLEAVTNAENVRRSRATKLTLEQVTEIRKQFWEKRAERAAIGRKKVPPFWRAALARRFGVCGDNIKAIVKGRSWA